MGEFMSAKITIGNFPAGTTIDEVREELVKFGAPVIDIEAVEGGDPDKLSFTVEIDIDPHTAKLMADRRKDRFFKGRKLTLFAPTMAD